MSRYDGLIIPRSYSEYINKTDAATLQQALQLSGVLSGAVAAGDNKAVKSSAVNAALANYEKITEYDGNISVDANTLIQQGIYRFNASYTGTATNLPTWQKTGGAILEVQNIGTYCTQRFIPYGDDTNVYIRKKSYGNGAPNYKWTEWVKEVTETDLDQEMFYKSYGYNNGLTHYFKMSFKSLSAGFLIFTGWNGNVWFEDNGGAPYRFSENAYGVEGYAWVNNNLDLWIKTGGNGCISVLIPSLSKKIAKEMVTFSEWTTIAPSGITFLTAVRKISYT